MGNDHGAHPDDVQEARRAEARGDAGRRAVGAAAAGRQRDGQGAGAGVPVAEDAGHGRVWDARGSGQGQGRGAILREPGAAVDACLRRISSRRSSTGGSRRSCSWMICWRGFRWSGTSSVNCFSLELSRSRSLHAPPRSQSSAYFTSCQKPRVRQADILAALWREGGRFKRRCRAENREPRRDQINSNAIGSRVRAASSESPSKITAFAPPRSSRAPLSPSVMRASNVSTVIGPKPLISLPDG